PKTASPLMPRLSKHEGEHPQGWSDADLAAALPGDRDDRGTHRHVILEVRPARGRIFVIGGAAVAVPILAAIARMLDSHEGGLIIRREERTAKLAANGHAIEQFRRRAG